MDTDVELKASLDSLLDYNLFISFEDEIHINTGVGFGAVRENSTIKTLMDSYHSICFKNKNGELDLTPCTDRNTNTLVELFNHSLDDEKYFLEMGIAILPRDYFCPFNPITGELKISNRTVGIHWYSASWRNKSINFREKMLRPVKRIMGTEKFNRIFKNQNRQHYIDTNENLCLLITGCINPNKKQKYLFIDNVDIRLNQYIDSITYYIGNSIFKKIVFCENSNFSYADKKKLYELAIDNGKELEWLSFQGDENNVVKYGKGYGEGEIINYALRNSNLLKTCHIFAKVTGRLVITNINSVICRRHNQLIVMNEDIYRRKGIDTRFYVIDKKIYQTYFIDAYKYSNDSLEESVALEDVFREVIINKKLKYSNSREYPRFVGISGGSGKNYSKESYLKLNFLDIICRLNILKFFAPLIYGITRIKQKIFYR